MRFDLEGIGDDGMGYTVTITTGNGQEIQPPRRAQGLVRRLTASRTLSRRGKRRNSEQTPDQLIEIVTRKSYDVRHSFHADRDDQKKTSKGTASERHDDMGIRMVDTGLSNTSNNPGLDSKVSFVGSERRESTNTTSGLLPRQPSTNSLDNNAQDVRESDGTLLPPTLPVATRTRPTPRYPKPATEPLNSSKWWNSSPYSNRAFQQPETDTAALMLDIVKSRPDQQRLTPSGSTCAADGSYETL
jgi:hypothetical protein